MFGWFRKRYAVCTYTGKILVRFRTKRQAKRYVSNHPAEYYLIRKMVK